LSTSDGSQACQDLEIVSHTVAYLDRTLLLIVLWNVGSLFTSDTASRQKKEDLFDARKKDMVECGDKENGWMKKQGLGLTKEEKREQRLKNYISPPGIKFRDARAETLYRERAARMLAANMCEKPDRVPVSLPTGAYPAYYAGYDYKRIMYDYRAYREAWTKFMWDFYEDMDTFMAGGSLPGPALDIMDNVNYAWPGHGVGDKATSHQYIEAAYIRAEEYDEYIRDPSDFGFRVLTPRTVRALESLKNFPALSGLLAIPLELAVPFARADVRDAFKKLIAAGEEMEKHREESGRFFMECVAAGFPMSRGIMGTAPFDLIADILRGTRGIAVDIYRQPEKILEAVEVITEKAIPRMINDVNAIGGTSVMFPLHKGDDTFLSRKQFEKFYWPTLKKVIDALIEEGISSYLFAEGSYNQRLDYLGDFPKGWVTWLFDQTDMAWAKKKIGDTCCISGNVPASLMVTGTPKEVKECCRRLIEYCAPGGGYILAGGAHATETKNPDNFRVFMEAAVEYGTY